MAAAGTSIPFGVGDRILIQGRHVGDVRFLGESAVTTGSGNDDGWLDQQSLAGWIPRRSNSEPVPISSRDTVLCVIVVSVWLERGRKAMTGCQDWWLLVVASWISASARSPSTVLL